MLKNSRLPQATLDKDFDSRKSCLVALLRSAFILEERRANLFFPVSEVKFLREPVLVCGAYQYVKEHVVASWDETGFRRTTASMYRHRLGAMFLAE